MLLASCITQHVSLCLVNLQLPLAAGGLKAAKVVHLSPAASKTPRIQNTVVRISCELCHSDCTLLTRDASQKLAASPEPCLE